MLALLTLAPFPAAHAGGPTCPADERVRAVRLARAARTHADAGDADEALALLREAWRACPDARLRHAQGKVLRQAGRLNEALAAFRACVDEGDEPDAVLCAPEVAAVEADLAHGFLVVISDTPGAVVWLDREPGPRPPGRVEVTAGRHALTVTANGHAPLRGVIDVQGGTEVRFEAHLEPRPDAGGALTGGSLTPSEPLTGATGAAPSVAGPSWPHWLGVGLGSALVLASALPFGQYALDRGDARAASATYSGDTVSPANLVLGSALAGLGVSAIVTAIALWPREVEVTVGPLPGGLAASLGVSW